MAVGWKVSPSAVGCRVGACVGSCSTAAVVGPVVGLLGCSEATHSTTLVPMVTAEAPTTLLVDTTCSNTTPDIVEPVDVDAVMAEIAIPVTAP